MACSSATAPAIRRCWITRSNRCKARSAKCRSSASASATSFFGRAIGATTYKLKFGHRGGNQPVKNLDTGRVEITSQNHGFAVDQQSLESKGGIVTHINLNDNTVEGFRQRSCRSSACNITPKPARARMMRRICSMRLSR